MYVKKNKIKYSFVLPCRNEEDTIGICIKKINEIMKSKYAGESYEIIISDSSNDKSPEIARKLGAKLVKHKKGYGDAYLEGFKAASGDILLMGDSDNTYDFGEIPKFLKYADQYDFVMGQRKYIRKGAMPLLHRFFGNPILSFILRLFFKSDIKDTHCGMRAIKRNKLEKLQLKTLGMEFASEMIVRALQHHLSIKQVDIHYFSRQGESNLNSFRDGWRHLRFMLLYAPDYLFIVPGLLFFLGGLLIVIRFLFGPVELFGFIFYNRPMIFGSFITISGYQILMMGIFAKAYMLSIGLMRKSTLLDKLAKFITFEKGIIIGFVLLLISLLIGIDTMLLWISRGFPGLIGNKLLFAMTMGVLAVQTMFAAFFISVLLIEHKT